MKLSEVLERWENIVKCEKQARSQSMIAVRIDDLLFLIRTTSAAVKRGLIKDEEVEEDDAA